MRNVIGAACGLWIGCTASAMAQSEPVVVVELYTSQGCSSCPPADVFLQQLASDPGVIALALHVDYWDYIGWEDAFGHEAFTKRQKSYARAIGSRQIYTPQFIVGGKERVEGNQPDTVRTLVQRHAAAGRPVVLTLSRDGERVSIHAEAGTPLDRPVDVQLVRYRPAETVAIERGENAGMVLDYANIVTSWEDVGDWAGKEPLQMDAAAAGTDPVVVILQAAGPSDIVAAARLD